MSGFRALLTKDMRLLLARPSSLAFVALFALSAGVLTFYPGRFFDADRADLSLLFTVLPWLLALYTPVLAMEGLSLERRLGTDALLCGLPLRAGAIVVAKWLSLYLLCLVALVLTMTLWVSISWLGRPDQGAAATGYLGAALMAAAYCAVVLAASAAVRQQALAFVAALGVNMVLTAGALPVFAALSPGLRAALAGLAIPWRQVHFMHGVLRFADAGFFVLLTLAGLYAATLLWRARPGAGWRIGLAALVFAGLNMVLVSVPARALRLDLTDAHIYRLSPAAKSVIAANTRVRHWTFYFSRALAAQYPDMRSYGARVEESLRNFAEASGGRIRLRIVDPGVDTPREDAALAAGMTPAPTDRHQPLYFGLAEANHARIARFDPARAGVLEYDLAAALDADAATRPPVALYDGLDLAGRDWFVTGRKQSLLYKRLEARYKVSLLKAEFGATDLAGHLVMLVHPPAFAPAQQQALRDFIAQGGRMMVFLDPYSEVSAQPDLNGQPRAGARMASVAPDVLARLGLGWSAGQIVLDRDGAMPAPDSQNTRTRQPAWIGVLPARLAADEPLTVYLQRGLVLASAAALQAQSGSGWRALLWSSANAALVPARTWAAGPDPAALMRTPPADGRQHWLGAMRDGLVVLGDADMLSDGFYVHDDPVFGRRARADNADFVLNTLDRLSGSDALLALRARTAPVRTLRRIDAMRARAQRRYRQAEAKAGDAPGAAAQRSLRAVRQGFARHIRTVEMVLEAINIWLTPALVLVLGGAFMVRRRRRHGETGSGPEG